MRHVRTAIFLACGWLILACTDNVSGIEYVERASGYFDRGEYQAAKIELKNALAEDKQLMEARLLLGIVDFETGEFLAAEKELVKARELGASDEAAVPILAKVLLTLGKNEDLRSLPVDRLSSVDQAMVMSVQALSALFQGESEQATILADDALSTHPESTYAMVAKGRILTFNGDYIPARQYLDNAVSLDPGFASAWTALGDLELLESNALNLAEMAYSRAIELKTNSYKDSIKRAMVRIRLEHYDEAQKDVDVLSTLFADYPGVQYAQGILHYQRREFDTANEMFENAATGGDDRYSGARLFQANIDLQRGDLTQAQRHLAQFRAQEPENIEGRKMLASMMISSGDYQGGEELLRPLLAASPNDITALNLLASALLPQGKTDEAIDLLAKVVEVQPESAAAQTRLGANLIAVGERDVGIEHLVAATQLDPQFYKADMILALSHVSHKNFNAAVAVAEDIRDRNPESEVPHLLLGRIYMAAGKKGKAKLAFANALELDPGDPGASIGLAKLAIDAGDYEAAKVLYVEVLKHHKNYLPVLMKLAALYALQDNEEAMVAELQQAITVHPRAVEPRVVLARYYLVKGDAEKVAPLFSDIYESSHGQPSALAVKGAAHIAMHEYTLARITLDKLVRLQPYNAEAHYSLALTYAGLGDGQKMESELQRTIELNVNHFAARVALAKFFLLTGDNDAFKQQLIKIREIAPEQPDTLKLEAVLKNLQGDPQKAHDYLDRAYQQAPTRENMLGLARRKIAIGDKAGAQKLLEQWVEARPDDLLSRLALGEFYAADENVEGALQQFSKALEIDENSFEALNNLAWYLRETNPGKALSYAERAVDINPDSADSLDTLALVLLSNGQGGGAQRTIDQALAQAPDNPSIIYHKALIQSVTGDKRVAIALLEGLMKDQRDFPEIDEARALLDRLQ